ncbi:MAG: L-threonate dehydrogenase [Pseudomonadota bacterium]
MNAAVIGLGSMGYGAARSILRAGIQVTGCDVVEDAVARFVAEGGRGAATPAEAAAQAEVIVVFVLNAQQARSVLLGSHGAVAAAPTGAVFVLCPTMPADAVESLAGELALAGMRVLDAPVSGGAAKAADGALTIMASGAPDAFDAAGPVLDAMAERVFRLGDTPGRGARIKTVNQLLAGVHIAAMAEALVLARRMGLDLDQVFDVIRQSAGSSWMFENRGPQVVRGDYTPHSAVEVFVKDLGIAAGAADGMDLPQLTAAKALFEAAAEAGLSAEADAAVAKVLARAAGVDLPGD